jgi:hypothetical protein
VSEDFDIGKYRTETPMDYLKAIKLINENSSNSEVANVIYRITRMHIPDLVFKYYSLTDDDHLNGVKLRSLSDKKVYLAESNSLNDPFDTKAFFYRNESLLKYSRLKRWNGRLIDDFSAYTRLTSFTSVGTNSMPMWAHYSNNHSGYCVEYNTKQKDNLRLTASLFPVQYTDERIDITPIMDSVMAELDQLIQKVKQNKSKEIVSNNLILVWISIYYSCLKHSSWNYEKEFRHVTSAFSRGVPYLDVVPSAIYVGSKCSDLNKRELLMIARRLNIPIYQMFLDEYSLNYELTSKLI